MNAQQGDAAAAVPAASLPGSERHYGPAMREALAEARRAAQAGDIPVGAVVLDPSGHTIARAANRREQDCDPSAHAEVLALRAAAQHLGSRHLEGCTLVVTLEPCTMCAGAIQLARLQRLVFGAWEPKTGAVGSQRDILRDPRSLHAVEVYPGVCAQECATLLREFFAPRRPSR